jgi:cystathionine beta-lyase
LRTFGWVAEEHWLDWIPGVVPGINLAARAVAAPGGAILMNTPVYYPFLDVPTNADQAGLHAPLVREGARWVIDFDRLEATVTRATRLLLACNPHNPTGRVYTRAELERLAEFALVHDLIICSDEIHASILLDRHARHVPIATLAPEVAARTITLHAPTKTYNIPGLGCAVAVIPNADLRARFRGARRDLVGGVGPLAFAAATAAFEDQSPWVARLLDYLRANHEALRAVAGERMTPVEATCLAWIDVRELALANPSAHFERHGLGLSIGEQFAGPGWVRFNFGCPRTTLDKGLERLARALDG